MKTGLLHRADLWLRQIMPMMTVFLLILLLLTPLHLPGWAMIPPWLPLIGVYYWTIYRPDLLPFSAVFAFGILQDVLASTPLGVMSLIYLLARGLTLTQRRFLLGKPFFVEWASFTMVLAGGLLLEWLLSSGLRVHAFSPAPQGIRLGLTVALYPLLSRLLSRLHAGLLHSA